MDGLITEDKSVKNYLVKVRDDYFHNADDHVKAFVDESWESISATDLYWVNGSVSIPVPDSFDLFKGFAIFNRINDVRRINKYLEKINQTLEIGGYLLINLETKNTRAERLFGGYPKLISHALYTGDFLLNRFLPKFKLSQKLYFGVTKGRNRVLTLTEAMGRLKSCGFGIIKHEQINGRAYILARKESQPIYDTEPTYGALVKLRRVGYKGKIIGLYKMRTMHPYSEYLQEYVYKRNGTANGDKLNDDFRVTSWGKVFRKFWIDELPMLWNWLKRDLKLVGVRPLSEHKFYTYPKHLQEKRTLVKPGLVPPFYADLPESPEEFFETEERYLDAYLKKPIRTDIRYFFKAMYNIFFRNARSS